MNRNKTAQFLNEWKSFLNEGKDPNFSEDEIGIKVVVEDCCGSCGTNSKEDIPPKGSPQEGTLKGHDMKNRDYFKEGKENFVLVHLSNEDSPRQFPQCCVKRKSDVE
tara:strand:+ start:225 stop:545 length:321 start_codon:yes stop_codon:yes gene_type:complete